MNYLFYICNRKLINKLIGHKNSRQATFVFSHKADKPLCKDKGLQIYGFLADYNTKV